MAWKAVLAWNVCKHEVAGLHMCIGSYTATVVAMRTLDCVQTFTCFPCSKSKSASSLVLSKCLNSVCSYFKEDVRGQHQSQVMLHHSTLYRKSTEKAQT